MIAVIAALVLAGGAALLSSSRPWAHVVLTRPAPFGRVTEDVTGRELFAAIPWLGLLAMLGAGMLLLTKRGSRRLVACVIVLAGAGLVTFGLRGLQRPARGRVADVLGDRAVSTATEWSIGVTKFGPVSCLVAGVAAVVLGAVALAAAGRWRGGLSGRYEAPAQAVTAEDAWSALDRGDDPTVGGQ